MRDHLFQIDGVRLRCSGVSFGYGDSDPYLVAESKHFAVIRCPATSEWSSRGDSFAIPAKWGLYRVIWSKYRGRRGLKVVWTVREAKPGRFWKRTKSDLIDLMKWEEQVAAKGGPDG